MNKMEGELKSEPQIIRPRADFPPSPWGDRFLNFIPKDQMKQGEEEQVIDELIEKVRRELLATAKMPLEQLRLIDEVQHLGLEYCFEADIEQALQNIYDSYGHDWIHNHDLFSTALWFRLLRQQGFNISCEIFKNFKDENGDFKETLSNDVLGLLALYEATYLRVHGEDILEDALAFTTTHLEAMAKGLSNPLAEQVKHALKNPIRRALTRVEAIRYIPIYQEDASPNETLLKLAKLDFNLLQSLHKQELSQLSRWWKDLDFTTKLPYVRDRLVENYFWALTAYFEPQYSKARKFLAKVFIFITVIDDTFDAYATYQEVVLFTEAVERWSQASLDILPDYMKICYRALLDIYEELEIEMEKEGKSYHVYYAKESMKQNVRAYSTEAKWLNEKYIPTMEEYIPVAVASIGHISLIVSSYVGMGDIVTEECLKWVFTDPTLVKACGVIARLMGDIASHKMEQERKHIASAIECYVKQYGVSEEYACDLFYKQVEDAWKDTNQEFILPTVIPKPLSLRVLNFSRSIDVIYKNGDSYTLVGKEMRDNIKSLLIDPVLV